ncbi:hypothetical protein P4C99_15170 [Pontiellaceae bacterium B1224]|nr:hypothetical protein [Pontiellaceae bacterium B1224]
MIKHTSATLHPIRFPSRTLCYLSLILFTFVSVTAEALDTLSLLDDGPSKSLLENKKPIYAEISGRVPVEFSDALTVFEMPDFLQRVQDEYGNQIDDEESPEFVINQTSSNTYFYVNRKGERTDITEELRKKTSDETIDLILYSYGKRSFGKYRSLVHIQVSDDGHGGSRYAASIYAYPENAFSRFFVRHLGLIERYFKNKTDEMTELFTDIICSLCSKGDEEKKLADA